MAYTDINSDLIRKKWMREGLLQSTSKSFWTPFTGNSNNSIVHQVNNLNASDGHTIVFDNDGNLAGKAVKGKDTAYGKGEEKKKFSSKITVDRYRLVASNGDAFDGVAVGDLSISQHSDSRAKLGDLFVRFKDQAIFDAAQGLNGQAPTHVIDLGGTFDYNTLLDIERNVKVSSNFTTGGVRAPLKPYILQNGMPVWLFIVDPLMAAMLKKSAGYQSMAFNADVRGNDNRAIKGVIGKLGSLMVVEADAFFGDSDGQAAVPLEMHETSVEISGLRRKDAAGLWSGMDGYSFTTDQISRGLIMGANALQLGFGMMPDYKFKSSQDFDITSESALETWMAVQKTKLLAEQSDYEAAKQAGYDYGVVAVDVKTIDV